MERRDVLRLLGISVVAAACSSKSAKRATSPLTSASTQPPSCILAPEQTEGPFYVDTKLVRRDITEGRPGRPLALDLVVVDAATCRPIPNAIADVWHADASGAYSDVQGGAPGTALRGMQTTGADGRATFDTIYPGWYPGRTPHIHVKVHVGGSVVHTGQVYFDEAMTDTVYAGAPYNGRGKRDTTNATDSIYQDGGRASMLAVEPGGNGLRGTITLGVRR